MGIKKPLVSIIILNWNQKELTLNCLHSLTKVNYDPIEIILVDNGSSDGTLREVKRGFPYVKTISNKTNVGYAKGNNQGYAIAKGKYILLLNNDTEVTPNFVSELVKRLESDNQYGVVQSKLYWLSDKSKNDMVGAYMTPTGFVYYFGYGKPDLPIYTNNREIFFAKGASMVIKREVIEQIGLFDEDYITYFEEYDFCWRVWLSGWKVVYAPKSVVYHQLNATGALLKKPFTVFLTSKNRITTMLKNLSLPFLFPMLFIHLLTSICVILLYLLFNKELAHSLVTAIFSNIKDLRKTIKKRKYIQNDLRKRSDWNIFLTNKNMVFPPPKYYLYFLKDMQFYKDINI